MDFFNQLVQNPAFIFSVLMINTILMIIFLVGLFIIGKSYKNLNSRYLEFMNKLGNGENVEKILSEYLRIVDEVNNKTKDQDQYLLRLENNLKKCIQKVGIVRYNAYGDTGSDLSFTLALMDSEDNGIVVNGLYSRESSSIFAKPLVKGDTKYNLSAEEIQAIDIAKTSSNARY